MSKERIQDYAPDESVYRYGEETSTTTNTFVGHNEKELEADRCRNDNLPLLRIGGSVIFFRSWEQFQTLLSSMQDLSYEEIKAQTLQAGRIEDPKHD